MKKLDQYLSEEINNIQNSRRVEKNRKRSKRKKIFSRIIAFMLSFLFISGCGSTKKNNNETTNDDLTINDTVDNNDNYKEVLSTVDLSKLGVELSYNTEEKKEYSAPTGDININDLVESSGKIWASSDDQKNSYDIGKEVLDTNGGTLEENSNGEVVEINQGYEIKKEDGSVDTGNIPENPSLTPDGTPIPNDNYAWDEDIDKTIISEDANTGLYVDPDGNVWPSKQKYDDYLNSLKNDGETIETTIIEDVISAPSPEVSSNEQENLNESTSNNVSEDKPADTVNNLYVDPVFGLTFQSEDDYLQWVSQDYEGYGISNGIMIPETEEMETEKQKVLTK